MDNWLDFYAGKSIIRSREDRTMKKSLFLTLVFLLSLLWLLAFGAPMPAEAQGVGLRCDTPHCRYAPYDLRGRWAGDRYYDGRHDYSPYSPYADSVYARGGTTIVNPAPGTTLKVVKRGGGLICLFGILSILGCGEETVDFSTAPKNPAPAPAESPPPASDAE